MSSIMKKSRNNFYCTKVVLLVTRKKEHDNQDIHSMKGGLEQKVEAFHAETRVKDSRLRFGKGIKEI